MPETHTTIVTPPKQTPSTKAAPRLSPPQTDISATSPDGRVTIRTDAQGRKWLGDVPYDVFFENPLAVVAEGRSVANNKATALAPASSSPAAKAPNAVAMAGGLENSPSGAKKTNAASGRDWDRLIEMDVLNAEVKRIRNELAAQLQSAARYNSHYQEVAIAGSTLAAVGQIVAEDKGTVSWKNNAPLVRDLGMKIHDAARAPGGQAFQSARTPYEQLVDVLDGNAPAGVSPAQPQRDFAEVASRGALMKRMDRSFQWLKKSGPAQQVLRKQSGNAVHESSLLAALGRVIAVGHYDSADDPKYKSYADELSQSAAAAAAAVKSEDAAAFTDAVGRVQKRCDACHAEFRLQ